MKKMLLLGGFILSLALTQSCQKQTEFIQDDHSYTGQELDGRNGSKTAQSIHLNVKIPATIIVAGHETWEFDELTAAISNHGYNSCNPSTSGQGNGNACRAAALSAARQAKCTYWDNGRQFWSLKNSNGNNEATVNVHGEILGESFLLGGQFKKNGKYSFTLTSNGISRVENLRYVIDGAEPVSLEHSIEDASVDNGCLEGFVYEANNGPYGNSSVFSYLKSNMAILDILKLDDNKNDSGCGQVQKANISPFQLSLGAGSHSLTILATVKGNDGSNDVNISVTKQFTISAEGCQN